MGIVYLNGQYLPQENAKVSIMDRGFLFGDAIYEVVPAYNGLLLGFDEHMQRMRNSLSAIYMQPVYDDATWHDICQQLLQRNNKLNGNHGIYIQITRGEADHRSHAIPKDLKPNIVAFCIAAKNLPKEEAAKGFSAITLDDTRRKENYVKATNLLPNILLYEQARRAGAIEAILTRDEKVLECTSSNIFLVKNGEIYTPPLGDPILSGVTRGIILKLAAENNIKTHEINISKAMLLDADEIWVTGSSKEICPITSLDNHIVGNGQVGPVWHKIRELYDTKKGS